MLTKEQYRLLKECELTYFGPAAVPLQELIAEYESANPPKPVAVPCSVCGSAAIQRAGGFWGCARGDCLVDGPGDDPDAAKWNKLHRRRKLPIKPPFVVTIEGNAYRTSNLLSSNCEFDGDPQDITEFLE